MGQIFATGDLHGNFDSYKLFSGAWHGRRKELTKDDVLIICGDFGWIWAPKEGDDEKRMLDKLEAEPYTTLVVDGNHENFDRLLSLPAEERYGGLVGVMRPSVLHLRQRGHIYDICEKKCWVCGGAASTDKARRTEGVSWWQKEQPSPEEYRRGMDELEANGWHADLAFTHDAPRNVCLEAGGPYMQLSGVNGYFGKVALRAKFGHWYCGHLHMDRDFQDECGPVSILYDRIVDTATGKVRA